jgi:hypothetical protein
MGIERYPSDWSLSIPASLDVLLKFMRGLILLGWLWMACSSWGQTNVNALPAFSLPEPHLKTVLAPTPTTAFKPIYATKQLTAEAMAAKLALEKDKELLAQANRVIVVPGSQPQNVVERSMMEIFDPVNYRFGHVVVGSSLTTAIAKKDPLCLLNPNIFWMSW